MSLQFINPSYFQCINACGDDVSLFSCLVAVISQSIFGPTSCFKLGTESIPSYLVPYACRKIQLNSGKVVNTCHLPDGVSLHIMDICSYCRPLVCLVQNMIKSSFIKEHSPTHSLIHPIILACMLSVSSPLACGLVMNVAKSIVLLAEWLVL